MKKLLFLFITFVATVSVFAQNNNKNKVQNDTLIVDKIVARVGNRIILESDIEAQYSQMIAHGQSPLNLKCKILEDLLFQKLLLNQADIDSIYASDDEVDQELNARLKIFIDQMGGVEKMENYFHKSIYEIKRDLKKVLADEIRAQKMEQKLTKDIKVTPSEVREYYEHLPKDSLPIVSAKVEVEQIVIKPKISKKQEQQIINRLRKMRQQILSGQMKFQTLAILYSEDPGSAAKGGDLGFRTRSELIPQFAAVAFSLKPGQVSDVVKTKYGYHIIQLVSRKGERVDVRHILLVPHPTPEEIHAAKLRADSIYNLIVHDSLTFEQAAMKFSDDPDTKNSGGLLFNQATGSSQFTLDQLPPAIRFDIKDMKAGQISKPIQTIDNTGQLVYKIYKIKSKTEAHVANLDQDYELIMNMALQHKKQQFLDHWAAQQIAKTYIHIDPMYTHCNFRVKAWLKYNQPEK